MNTQLNKQEKNNISVLENIITTGDLRQLDSEGRIEYYKRLCESLNLNPLTRPFEYLTLNGKLILYARKDATEQLRFIRKVSITKIEKEIVSNSYVVTAHVQDKDGRTDVSVGAVNIDGLKGDALANAIMKAETKAKRRATLSIVGLGFLDESEIETIADARTVDAKTVEVIDHKKIEQNKTEVIADKFEKFVQAINSAPDMNYLKDIFIEARNIYKDDQKMQLLIDLKEKRKLELIKNTNHI